jgi:Domain of Unknown Function (DUF1521)
MSIFDAIGAIASVVFPPIAPVIGAVKAITGGGPKPAAPAPPAATSGTSTASTPTTKAASTSAIQSEFQSQSALPESIRKAIAATSSALSNPASKTTTPETNIKTYGTTASATPTSSTACANSSATSNTNSTNATTRMQDGQAVFENDNYIITAGDNNTVTIYNKKSKEVYEALGNADMKVDGKEGFKFTGTTSLVLDDGTKVTLGKAEDGKDGTLASKLTITNGAYGAQIKGIDTNKTGDLAVQEFQGQGEALDQRVADGVVIKENQNININNGRGFSVADVNGNENAVDQKYMDAVDKRTNKGEQGVNLDKFDTLGAQSSSTAQPTAPDNSQTMGTKQTQASSAQDTRTNAASACCQPAQKTAAVAKKPKSTTMARDGATSATNGNVKGNDYNNPAQKNTDQARICRNLPRWAQPQATKTSGNNRTNRSEYIGTNSAKANSIPSRTPAARSPATRVEVQNYYNSGRNNIALSVDINNKASAPTSRAAKFFTGVAA